MKDTNLNGKSKDIVTENIQQLKQLFPDVFAEESIDFDKLKAVLGEYVDDDEERYNFTWWGKSKALRLAQTPSTGTLRPCPEESKDWDSTQNLYIEGDNLEVLKLLQKTYHNKVKMIYIDPPYNTGKDFVYPDDYRDGIRNYKEITRQIDDEGHNISTNSESDGRYHTNWLNMMYPRLRLARNLLRNDGVIFISIDDNEEENLIKICNEIFGEENFVGKFAVQLNPRGRHLDKFLAQTHEYVIVFAKSVNQNSTFPLPKPDEMLREYNRDDEKGKYRDIGLRNRNPAFNSTTRPNLFFPIYVNTSTGGVSLEKDDKFSVQVLPLDSKNNESCWTWGRTKVKDDIHLLVARQTNNGEWRIIRKDYLVKDGETATTLPKSIWLEKEINNDYGKKAIQELFGNNQFDFPKSPYFLQKIIQIGSKDGLVLDFFAGSATAAHSVFLQNLDDNHSRQFIMVQLPEEVEGGDFSTIAEIGKERIRRAGDKIKAELKERYDAQQGQMLVADEDKVMNPDELDIGFKVFKLDSSNLKKWHPDADNLEESLFDSIENFVEGRSELDMVYEIMLKYGIDLTLPIKSYAAGDKNIYSVGFGALMICLDNEITTKVAQEIVKLKAELSPEVMRGVFKDNGFKDDSAKTNTKEILRTNGVDEIVSI